MIPHAQGWGQGCSFLPLLASGFPWLVAASPQPWPLWSHARLCAQISLLFFFKAWVRVHPENPGDLIPNSYLHPLRPKFQVRSLSQGPETRTWTP
jgi:hypothetical protein